MEGKMDTQDKIIATAIDMVGRHINLDFTVRELAEKANVNLASVNYYFRSKYNLFDEVEKYFVRQSHRIYEEVARLDVSPREKLKFWAIKTMEHIMEYPGVIYLIVTKLIHQKSKNAGVVGLIDTLEYNITPLVKGLTGVVDDFTVSAKLMQLFSGVVTPVLLYYGAGRTFNVDLQSREDREAYVESLIESIL